jgi:5-oxoprolinase (ATP-hydrolysing)
MVYQQVVEINERVQVHPAGVPPADHTITVQPSGELFDIVTPLDRDEVREKLSAILTSGIRCIAVAFVHSYVYKEHEAIVKEIATELGFDRVSLSSEIMPMVKLVPRASTACIDAYLTPAIHQYIT